MILVETVGVGQSEVEIAGLADTTLVLLAPGHGRRHPGREGRDPRDRRRLRRQQGRPRRRRPGPPRPALDARAGRAARGRLAAADREDRRARRARASTRWSPRSTSTAPGWSRRGELERRRVPAAPATRSRRSRSPRCASAGATSTAAPSSTTSPPRSSAGDDRPVRRRRRAAGRLRRLTSGCAVSIASGPVIQICWVTDDIEATERLLSRAVRRRARGPGSPTSEFGPETTTLRGEPADCTAARLARVRRRPAARADPAGARARSIHREFLDAHGPGLHHVCFAVDDVDAACAAAEAAGVPVLMRGSMMDGEIEFAYVDGVGRRERRTSSWPGSARRCRRSTTR